MEEYYKWSHFSSDFERAYLLIYNELEGLQPIQLKVFESSFQQNKLLVKTISE